MGGNSELEVIPIKFAAETIKDGFNLKYILYEVQDDGGLKYSTVKVQDSVIYAVLESNEQEYMEVYKNKYGQIDVVKIYIHKEK